MTQFGRLWIIPPEPATRRIDLWRSRYDAGYRLAKPHITLGSKLENGRWSHIRPGLARVLTHVSPFEISLSRACPSKRNTPTLWLELSDPTLVAHIQDLLERDLRAFTTPEPDFVPHVSIGWFGREEDREAAKESVEADLAELGAIHFRVDALAYVYPDEDEIWQTVDIISLDLQRRNRELNGDPPDASRSR
jgi:2'-5' RNA ligase